MSTTASPALYVLPNGLEPPRPGQVRRGRVILLLLPQQAGGGLAEWRADEWPVGAHRFLDQMLDEGAIGFEDPRSARQWQGRLLPAVPRLTEPQREAVKRLWYDAMSGGGLVRDGFSQLIQEAMTEDADTASSFATLPLPVAEASLLMPLERARMMLELMAAPESSLLARALPRPPMTALAAHNRPWLDHPDQLTQLAIAGGADLEPALARALFGPPDVLDWLRAGSLGDADPAFHIFTRPLDPDAIARAAIGRGEEDLLWLSDRLHALHHAAFNPILLAQQPSGATPAATVEPDTAAGGRRLHQLLASPALMRLFGWARDALVELPETLPAGPRAWRCTAMTSSESSTFGGRVLSQKPVAALLDRDGGGFWPAHQADWPALLAPERTPAPYMRRGLRVLSGPDGSSFRATSLEPLLSTEADHQTQRRDEAGPRPSGRLAPARLVTGPLALIQTATGGVGPGAAEADGLMFAAAFEAPPRLLLGIDMADGDVSWHETSARTVTLLDRLRSGRDREWPNQLAATLFPVWMPRAERDAAGVAQMTFQQEQQGACTCLSKDPRIAAYHGDDLGVGANELPSVPLQNPRQGLLWQGQNTVLSPTDDLLVTQSVGIAPEADLAPLRFGWSYHFALAPRRLAGGGVTSEAARAALAADPGLAFPAANKPGFRYLRHEPIASPMVLLAPGTPFGPARQHQLQTSAQMVLVRAVGNRAGAARTHTRTARVLLAPSVSLSFAERHDVLRADTGEPGFIQAAPPGQWSNQLMDVRVNMPRQGLTSAFLEEQRPRPSTKALSDRDNPGARTAVAGPAQHASPKAPRILPPRLRVRRSDEAPERRQTPYYPDPAAAYMVLRLARAGGPNEWLDDAPLVLRLRPTIGRTGTGRWPDLTPVRLELVATETARAVRLRAGGLHQEEGAPATSGRSVNDPPLSVPMQLALVEFAPGEEALLRAWCVPEAADLEAWFDAVESIEALSAAEGRARGATSSEALCDGFAALLALRHAPGEAPEVAASLHAHLLREPMPGLTETSEIRLIHATDAPSVAPSFVDGRAAVARPASVEPAALEPFLARIGAASGWAAAGAADDDATRIIPGGQIAFDPSTTAGLTIDIEMAAPQGETIDGRQDSLTDEPEQLVPREAPAPAMAMSPDGLPDLGWPRLNASGTPRPPPRDIKIWPRWVPLLEVTEIPPPGNARAGARRFALEQIIAGTVPELAGASVAFKEPLEQAQARQARLRIRGVARHGGLVGGEVQGRAAMNQDPAIRAAAEGPATQPLWVPATARPAPPRPRDLTPMFMSAAPLRRPDGAGFVIEGARHCSLRLSLRRPWFTSGEEERLGIILWPPPAFGLADGEDAVLSTSPALLDFLHESDLGPLGRFVSVWGLDPLGPRDRSSPNRHRFLERSHFSLGDGTEFHPRLLLPMPGIIRPEPGAEAVAAREAPRESAADVAVLSVPVRYTRDEAVTALHDVYVDLDLRLPVSSATLFRLALTRVQMRARPDRRAMVTAAGRAGIRLSPPAIVEGSVPPLRRYAVRVVVSSAPEGQRVSIVSITLSGPGGFASPNRRVRMWLNERRGAEEFMAMDEAGFPASASWIGDGSSSTVFRQVAGTEERWTTVFRIAGDIRSGERDLAARIEEDGWLPGTAGGPSASVLPRFSTVVDLLP